MLESIAEVSGLRQYAQLHVNPQQTSKPADSAEAPSQTNFIVAYTTLQLETFLCCHCIVPSSIDVP
jgi:hypothetical protein